MTLPTDDVLTRNRQRATAAQHQIRREVVAACWDIGTVARVRYAIRDAHIDHASGRPIAECVAAAIKRVKTNIHTEPRWNPGEYLRAMR